jgi:hypothetical protein
MVDLRSAGCCISTRSVEPYPENLYAEFRGAVEGSGPLVKGLGKAGWKG